MPTGGTGVSRAWNYDGPQSLWIDFGTAMDFISGAFATLSTDFGLNAFGYDATDALVATRSVLNLGSTFQTLNANLTLIGAFQSAIVAMS